MNDKTIMSVVATIVLGLIECSAIVTKQDGQYLGAILTALALIAGYTTITAVKQAPTSGQDDTANKAKR